MCKNPLNVTLVPKGLTINDDIRNDSDDESDDEGDDGGDIFVRTTVEVKCMTPSST